MLKNKIILSIAAGGMALVGMIAGTAFMVSAQGTGTTTNTPAIVANTTNTASGVVDTPESANDPVDSGTSSDSGTNVTVASISVGHPSDGADKANDSDGGAASETSEPASASGTSDQ